MSRERDDREAPIQISCLNKVLPNLISHRSKIYQTVSQLELPCSTSVAVPKMAPHDDSDSDAESAISSSSSSSSSTGSGSLSSGSLDSGSLGSGSDSLGSSDSDSGSDDPGSSPRPADINPNDFNTAGNEFDRDAYFEALMTRFHGAGSLQRFREEERQREEAEQRKIELDANDTRTLHDFPKLPPELRRRVWELFCPDLDAKHRVLNFNVESQQRSKKCAIRDGMELAEKTLPLRRTASVCQDSRELVHRLYPDTLRINANFGDLPHGEILFSKQRDMPVLKFIDGPMPPAFWEDGFFEKLSSVAFAVNRHAMASLTGVPEFLAKLPNLQNIYLCRTYDIESRRLPDVSWCGSPLVNLARVITTEEDEDCGELYYNRSLYCWPDRSTLSLDPFAQGMTNLKRHLDPDLVLSVEETGVKLVPMILFEGEDEYAQIHLRFMEGNPVMSERESDSEEEEDFEGFGDPESEDEEENDGFIDDTEQPELVESSEDELVPRGIVSGDESEDDSDDDSNGPSAQLVQEAAGRFSSPEPEPEGEKDEGSPAITRRPKRRVVEDSDDEEEVAAPSRKRARQVISSDEEDEADEADEKPDPPAKKPVPRRAVSSESSSEEGSSDEDESEDEEEAAKKHVPVWKQPAAPARETTGRARARKDADEDSSEVEAGYDHETADDDDGEEEQDDEEDEEGVEYGGYGLVDDMAVESGEGEENSDEEGNW